MTVPRFSYPMPRLAAAQDPAVKQWSDRIATAIEQAFGDIARTTNAYGSTVTLPLAVISTALQGGSSYANDTAAAAGGVALGQWYRNGSVLQMRIT